jgi:hypothetical protein
MLISLRNESNGLICLEFLRFWKEQVQKSNLPDSDPRLQVALNQQLAQNRNATIIHFCHFGVG